MEMSLSTSHLIGVSSLYGSVRIKKQNIVNTHVQKRFEHVFKFH